MHGPVEAKRILNRHRSRAAKRGQRNGGYGWLDNPWLERLIYNSKRGRKRSSKTLKAHSAVAGGDEPDASGGGAR